MSNCTCVAAAVLELVARVRAPHREHRRTRTSAEAQHARDHSARNKQATRTNEHMARRNNKSSCVGGAGAHKWRNAAGGTAPNCGIEAPASNCGPGPALKSTSERCPSNSWWTRILGQITGRKMAPKKVPLRWATLRCIVVTIIRISSMAGPTAEKPHRGQSHWI